MTVIAYWADVWAHVWQSTIFLLVAALLAYALRRAPARVRHAIWLAASIKFLVPLSLLVLAGRYVGALTTSIVGTSVSGTLGWIDRSIASWSLGAATPAPLPIPADRMIIAISLVMWAAGALALLAWRWTQWRRLEALASKASRVGSGREHDAMRRLASPHMSASGLPPLAILESGSHVEPGVFGILRPTLLWPAGLSDRLDDAELEAVLSHEICHVKRRDNLSAAIQIAVETVFWFYPMVWWLGSRLVNERERACDEEVVLMGTNTRSYAEGILKVCGFCLRSPAPFLARAGAGRQGLTGRIAEILSKPPAPLSSAWRALLMALAIASIATPLAAGVLRAHGVQQDQQDKVYRVSDGVKTPKLVHEVKPVYTVEAKRARIQGSVWLQVVITDTGLVGDVVVTQSLDTEYGLDEEAVKAVRQWVFEPGTKDGKAVAVQVDVEMTFKMK